MKLLKRTISLILTLCLLGGTLTVLAVDWPTNITGGKTVVLKGIDVSEHQGYSNSPGIPTSTKPPIDWDAVKNSGVDFVMIRSGYGAVSRPDGDYAWLDNAVACASRNIPFGVYYYCYADSPDDPNTDNANKEADNCIHQLDMLKARGYRPTLPVFYDIEESDTLNHNPVAIINTFCDRLKAAGYETGIYAGSNNINDYMNGLDYTNKYLWMADWRDVPDANLLSKATYLQFTSGGSIPGISGNVDLDVCLNPSQSLLDAVAKNRFALPDGSFLDFTSPSYRLAFISSSPEITKIPSETPVSTFLSGLASGNTTFKMLSGGNEVGTDSKVATGMTVQLYLKDDAKTPFKSFTTVVTGDINGDGSVGLSDLIQIEGYLLGKTQLAGAAKEAAEISGGSDVSLTDLIQIESVLLGKSSITPR